MTKIFRIAVAEEPQNAVLLSNAGLLEELGSLRHEAWIRRLRSAAPIAIQLVPPTPRHKTRDVSRCDVHFYGDKLIFSTRAIALISRLHAPHADDFIEFISAEHGRRYCFAPTALHHCLTKTSTFRSMAHLDGKDVPIFVQQPKFAEEMELPAHVVQCRHPMIDSIRADARTEGEKIKRAA